MTIPSSPSDDHTDNIILFPELEALKKEVSQLRTEVSMLLLERDELRFVVCKNIETAYLLALGGLEYKAFELNCKVLRLKRKIDLIQSRKNRQEKIILSDIENVLDTEFAEFQQQLDEQVEKMNAALEYTKGRPLTEEETKELKKLYRSIVKVLHPDIHPEVSAAQIQLFQNAVDAYENCDLFSLRIISEMVSETVVEKESENTLSILTKEKDRLAKNIQTLQEQIQAIKEEYPYTMKELIHSPERIAEEKKKLEELIDDLKEVYHLYSARLDEMLR